MTKSMAYAQILKLVINVCPAAQSTLRILGHEDDVNAVAFMDASPNIIVSGSDDTSIKVAARSCHDGWRHNLRCYLLHAL